MDFQASDNCCERSWRSQGQGGAYYLRQPAPVMRQGAVSTVVGVLRRPPGMDTKRTSKPSHGARRVSRCKVPSSRRLRLNAAARFDDAWELIDAPPARSCRRAGDTGAAQKTASRSPSEGGFDRDPAFQHSGLGDDDPQELSCGACWRSRRLTQRTSSTRRFGSSAELSRIEE
jgi:hypothetical protein